MHVLVVGRPRCRTSFITSAYSSYYDLKNYHEEFNINFYKFFIQSRLTKKALDMNLISNLHRNHLKSKTEEIFKNEKSIIKLFPRNLINHYSRDSFEILENFEYQFLSNISEILNLEKYNKIVVLERNFLDSAISYIYGKQMGMMLYSKKFVEKEWIRDQDPKITISKESYNQLNFYVLEFLFYQHLKEFIVKNYSTVELDFEDTVEFVSLNFNNLDSNRYADPKFNYKNIIENYEEVSNYLNNRLFEYSKKYKKVEFY